MLVVIIPSPSPSRGNANAACVTLWEDVLRELNIIEAHSGSVSASADDALECGSER